MSETTTPRAGQYWTLETNGTRVEILYVTQYGLDQMVMVRSFDRVHPDTEVRVEWFVNHATLLHDSYTAAKLEAQKDELARRSAEVITGLTEHSSRTAAKLADTEALAHSLTDQVARQASTIRSRDRQISHHAESTRALSENWAAARLIIQERDARISALESMLEASHDTIRELEAANARVNQAPAIRSSARSVRPSSGVSD